MASVGSTLAIILSYLNTVHPLFDTLANFRFHLAIAAIAISLLWLVAARLQIALTVGMVGVFALSSVTSGLAISKNRHQVAADTKRYTLLAMNVRFDNPHRNDVLKTILHENPDIFVATEVSTLWSDVVARLEEEYPHAYHCPEWANVGGGYIFSKFTFTQQKQYCHEFAALGVSEVTIENTPIAIGIVHLRWPWPASQPKQLLALEPYLKTLGDNALIAGDFNAGTWTQGVRHFAKSGNLKVVENIGLTWMYEKLPTSLAKWIGLPIDNALYKGAVKIVSAKTLEPNGSDHLPIKIEFVIE